jgi:bifunctional non-homologous end joining protein LigD
MRFEMRKGKKAAIPKSVQPMLCTLVKKPFNDPDYLYEVKWDGYRIVAFVNKGRVRLDSRSQLNYTAKYPPVVAELEKLGHNAVIDGEMVGIDAEGKPSFDLLQKAYKGQYPLQFYCFDILWLDGYDLKELPLTERKAILQDILPKSDVLKYSDSIDDGLALFAAVKENGLEGIVAKKRESNYIENDRSRNWLKMQTDIRSEYVIGGWTESGSGRPFRSLLFGNYQNDKLVCVGHAGGGYKDKDMPGILQKLKQLEIKKKPFTNEVETDTKAHWVKPVLVANFKFATFTKSGKVRKPAIFIGFRSDKEPDTVVPEKVIEVSDAQESDEQKWESNWKKLDELEITSKEIIKVEGCPVQFHNVEKTLWKGVTKFDLIQYYHKAAKYILPYLKHRPLSLHIKHIAPGAPGMYIKDMEGRQPDCADIFTTPRKHKKEGAGNTIDYLVCNNLPTLLWMINVGCIDVNPWTSNVNSPASPDYIVIDLDPSDDDFKKAIAAAKAAKKVIDRYKLVAFIKTSGKTGIHIYIPCSGFTFPDARSIAEHLCDEIHELLPDITTTNVNISSRGKKVYLDPNQNDFADTVAAPYSVRPANHPRVSTPLDWKEINNKLNADDFTIHTILDRLKQKGDLFKGVLLKPNQSANNKILRKLIDS